MGRISVLKHRYHVGRYLAGEAVVESIDGLLNVTTMAPSSPPMAGGRGRCRPAGRCRRWS
jgi:hypothetical protein